MTTQPPATTVANLRQQAAVRQATRPVEPPSPLSTALALKEQIIANSLLDQTQNDLAAAAATSVANRYDAEARVEEAKAKRQAAAGEGSFAEYALSEIRALKEMVEGSRESQTQDYLVSLRQEVGSLRSELSNLRTDRPSPTDSIKESLGMLDEIQSVIDRVRPPLPAPSGPADHDPTYMAYKLRVETAAEQHRMEFEDRREARREALVQDRQLKEAELDLLRGRQERTDRFIDQTAPKIVELLSGVLQAWTGKTVPAPAPLAQAQQLELPAGVQRTECSNCHAPILYREEWPGFICNSCGAEYSIHPDEGSPGE